MNGTKIFTLQFEIYTFVFVIIYRMTQLVYRDKLGTMYEYVLGEQYYKEANWGFAASCK